MYASAIHTVVVYIIKINFILSKHTGLLKFS
jgi:hypothetical protein